MYNACIAAIDATRGRLFHYQRTADGSGMHESFVEDESLVNPARHERPSELFSDKPGSSRVAAHGFGLDDHRDYNLDKLDETFARWVLARIRELCDQHHSERVIVCASPRMLGHLRACRNGILGEGQILVEVPRDYTKLAPDELRDRLAAHHLLPSAPPRS
ncbi:MAG: host attachment protein, partial [Deltaproteobacteria bacterium]